MVKQVEQQEKSLAEGDQITFAENLGHQELLPHTEVLNERELQLIEKRMGLKREQVISLITEGFQMLGTTEVTDGGSFNPFDELAQASLECDFENLPPSAIQVGGHGVGMMGIYIQNDSLETLTKEIPEGDTPLLDFYYQNTDHQVVDWLKPITAGTTASKIPLDNTVYPRESTFFFYSLKRGEEPVAIFPFKTNTLDIQIEPEGATCVERTYVRATEKEPELEKYEVITMVANEAIREMCDNLGIEPLENIEFIWDDDMHYDGSHRKYTAVDGSIRNVFVIGSLKLKVLATEKNIKRLVRHEYMHAIDTNYGEGNQYFSEEIAEEIVGIINDEIGQENKVQLNEDDPALFTSESKEFIAFLFSESHVFEDVVMMGHADENIRELMASLVNAATDQDVSEGIYDHDPFVLQTWQSFMGREATFEEVQKVRQNVYARVAQLIKARSEANKMAGAV